MTHHRLVTLRLPCDLITTIEAAARAQALAPADVIRNTLVGGLMAQAAPGPARLSEMALIRAEFERAEGWLDLQSRLRHIGFVLRLQQGQPQIGARLGLHEWPSDHFVIWLEEIGFSLAQLSLRFRAPFPGALPRHAVRPVMKARDVA